MGVDNKAPGLSVYNLGPKGLLGSSQSNEQLQEAVLGLWNQLCDQVQSPRPHPHIKAQSYTNSYMWSLHLFHQNP